jgi:hypothetical protein
MPTNMHDPPGVGNFSDKHSNTLKVTVIQDYRCHIGYVDKGDRMADSYSVGHHTWKLTKKFSLHLLDLTVLNSCILLQSCCGKIMQCNL